MAKAKTNRYNCVSEALAEARTELELIKEEEQEKIDNAESGEVETDLVDEIDEILGSIEDLEAKVGQLK